MGYKTVDYLFVILSEEERKTFGYNSQIEEGVVYIDDEQMWLRCPCGCGQVYKLNTYDGIKPRWEYLPPNSIKPSINHTTGCMSHFTITNGSPTGH